MFVHINLIGVINMNMRIRTATMGERGQIVIPEEMRTDLNLQKKEALVLIERNNEIILRKESEVIPKILEKENVLEKMSSALLSEKSLAKDWMKKEEDKAWEDL